MACDTWWEMRLKVETEIWFVRTAYCVAGEFVNSEKSQKTSKGQKTMEKGKKISRATLFNSRL